MSGFHPGGCGLVSDMDSRLKCDQCENEATVHDISLRHGTRIERHLCEGCAREAGLAPPADGSGAPTGGMGISMGPGQIIITSSTSKTPRKFKMPPEQPKPPGANPAVKKSVNPAGNPPTITGPNVTGAIHISGQSGLIGGGSKTPTNASGAGVPAMPSGQSPEGVPAAENNLQGQLNKEPAEASASSNESKAPSDSTLQSPVPVSVPVSGSSIGSGNTAGAQAAKAATLVCTVCGMKYSEFKQHGLIGCEACYKTFESLLLPLIERAHEGGTHHLGKSPLRIAGGGSAPDKLAEAMALAQARAERVRTLTRELESAIHTEKYELAAKLRDQLRQLQGGSMNSETSNP